MLEITTIQKARKIGLMTLYPLLKKKMPKGAAYLCGSAIRLRMLPVTIVFFVFFVGSSLVQFFVIIKGYTPFPRWYALFNLLIVSVFFNAFRRIGNYAIVVSYPGLASFCRILFIL